jgi:energy-coupling factor transport system permease protein
VEAQRTRQRQARPESQNGQRQARLDPRSKLLLVLVVSLAVMHPDGLRFVPAALVLGAGMPLAVGAWRRSLSLVAATLAMWVGGWLLPHWWLNPVSAVIALACVFTIRLVVCVGVGVHVVLTTSPTQLSAALRALHAPRPIAVTLAVMFRYFPTVAAEARAVLDAMRLRGLAGAGGLFGHPVQVVERFTVSMVAASLRAGEDLSASALLRGLGSRCRPTAMFPPRFGWADLGLVLLVAALAAGSFVFGPLLS